MIRYSVKELAELVDGIIEGDEGILIDSLQPFYDAEESDLTFAADEKFLINISETKAKAVIVPDIQGLPKGKTYIKVRKNPREIMPVILNFFKKKLQKPEKSIEDSAQIGENVQISPNCYIGHNVKIGKNSIIYPNVSIMEGTEIGEDCLIYSNVSIREFCIIENRVIIQMGAVIGSDGFGFVKLGNKNFKLEQIGRVIIKDDVEIGANAAIDRGAIGDTVIGRGTKMDNLVHVAHNDIIGENCLITAQVGISGSVTIGSGVTIAGQTGIAGHLKIGNNVTIGAKSGVTNNIKDGMVVSGFPVKDHYEDLKIKVAMGRLPEIIKKVKELEKKVGI
jgi:UDP-3-O-[3-hydroxymyristoyl] glucosamine N-acyltransferase